MVLTAGSRIADRHACYGSAHLRQLNRFGQNHGLDPDPSTLPSASHGRKIIGGADDDGLPSTVSAKKLHAGAGPRRWDAQRRHVPGVAGLMMVKYAKQDDPVGALRRMRPVLIAYERKRRSADQRQHTSENSPGIKFFYFSRGYAGHIFPDHGKSSCC